MLSIVENAFVGHSYEPHADVFRPFTGFMPRYYMFLHPFLLGLLFASSWAVVTGPTFSNNHAGMKLAGAVGAAGALPVYTLGFARHRTPPNIVASWQFHTAMQLLAGGWLLDSSLVSGAGSLVAARADPPNVAHCLGERTTEGEQICITAEEISVQHWRGSVLSGIDSLDDALPPPLQQLKGKLWRPPQGRVRGVIIIAHGVHQTCGLYGPQYTDLVPVLTTKVNLAVLCLDFRGFGRSNASTTSQPWGDDFRTTYVADVAAAVGLSRRLFPHGVPVWLFGHSLGGLVVSLMASSSPLSSSRFAGGTLPLAPGAIAALRSVKGILLSAPSLAYEPIQEVFEGKLVDAIGWALPGFYLPGAALNLDKALGGLDGSNAPYPRNTLKAWANAASESLAFPAG